MAGKLGDTGLVRSDTHAILASTTSEDREMMKRELRPVLKIWCEWVRIGVEQGARHALNNYAKAMELFAPDINISLVITKELGVSSLSEARASVIASLEAKKISEDPEAMAASMLEWLTEYYRPQKRKVVVLEEA